MQNRKNKFLDRPYLSWVTVSLITCIISECVNQRGISGFFRFIFASPYAFILNLAIVMLTYSAVLFIKRRLFCYTLTASLWTVMTAINLVLLIQRNTQFNCSDILIFRYGIFITTRYLSILHCILIMLGIGLVTAFVVYLYKKGYRCDNTGNKKQYGVVIAILTVITVSMGIFGNIGGLLLPRFTNIAEGYEKNGFVYAFFCSVAESGVDEPEELTDVENIIADFITQDRENDIRSNVIFVQLESFIDP
ncbi:MAG: hypothetical protein IKU19_07810, partial [Clostridia bacterium]|nr:hypothetical protein [Clostridia bacterium]